MPWWKPASESNKEGLEDVELTPDKFKADLNKDIDAKLADLNTKQQESLRPMLDFIKSQQEERDARLEAERLKREKDAADNNKISDEDFMLDPAAATRKLMEPTQRALVSLAARQVKQDVLSDKEFYHGEIKTKVDQMLAQQPLQSQTDASVVENCYKLVMFDYQKDISDGKIKSRNSNYNMTNEGTGGHSGDGGADKNEVLSEDEKKAAKAFGMSEKDWVSARKEMTYV